MRKGKLINSEVSYVIAKLGHFDGLTVADAGLPIPASTQRIDLAVSEGVPSFMDMVKAIVPEMEIQSVELAEEFRTHSPALHDEFIHFIGGISRVRGKNISVEYITHDIFKSNTESSVAVVRTGEHTPYANVTFKAGVVF